MKTGVVYNLIQEGFSRTYALVSPTTVLDIGRGSGRFGLYVGIDPNPFYIAYCRRHRHGRFEQMSGDQLDFADRSFAMVLAFSGGRAAQKVDQTPLGK